MPGTLGVLRTDSEGEDKLNRCPLYLHTTVSHRHVSKGSFSFVYGSELAING